MLFDELTNQKNNYIHFHDNNLEMSKNDIEVENHSAIIHMATNPNGAHRYEFEYEKEEIVTVLNVGDLPFHQKDEKREEFIFNKDLHVIIMEEKNKQKRNHRNNEN